MALIKCPECGRENISDSASICPVCGFPIKNHFQELDKQRRYDEYQIKLKRYRQMVETREKEIGLRFQDEIDSKLKEAEEIPCPEKPSMLKVLTDKGTTIFMVVFILFTAYAVYNNSLYGHDALMDILGITVKIYLFVIPCVVIVDYLRFRALVNAYPSRVEFWERSKQRKKEEVERLYSGKISSLAYDELAKEGINPPEKPIEMQAQEALQAQREREVNQTIDRIFEEHSGLIKCPICGGTDINRISTASRAVSVATVGLASGKIGKQYKCNKCQHMW